MSLEWTPDLAWEWYSALDPIRGCNYLPRTAVNSTEMWQAEGFSPTTIGEELGWAADAGYNSARVFLPFVVWAHDADGLKGRMSEFLSIAAGHGIRTMWILFDDCAFAGKEPFVGPQDDPVPGVHNSGWTPSPGHALVDDPSAWPALEAYVRDIVGAFADDERVLVWDIYNEPGMSGAGDRSAALVEAACGWAREAAPSQPLTVGAYSNEFSSAASRRLMELSDVVSFHGYDCPGRLAEKIATCGEYGRPVLCTECVVRRDGNDFEQMLPLFAERKVGWYNWGLVAGRTQTYMPWGSEEGTPMPDAWQHDVLHADGTPYDPEELERIREFGWLEVDDVVPPGGEWRYATDTPWYGYQLEAYDETKSEWHSGKAPFAAPGTPHAEVGTEWTTPNIWMRRTFTLDGLDVRALRVRVRHDAQAEVHINGELAVRVLGANTCGELLPIRDSARAALRLGENTLAVHCHRAGESQGIDVGLADIRSGVPAEPNGAAVELPEAGEVDCGPLWAAERTADWYERVGALKGCNYLPRTAINPIEMWQAETFDPETIDEELGWAAGYGYNSLRIFLPYLVWEAERDGLLARFERVLGICATHGMTAMPVFFDDVCFSQKLEPYLGPQDDPIVGIHNSGWVPSPGFAAVTDRREWPKLKAYVDDFVTRYREDERVVVWDIYNEPGPFFDVTTSFNLAKAGASWVRELDPIQPVTVPVWGNPDSRQLPAISDVASIHNYGGRGLEEFIQHQQAAGKPVLVTEWLARPSEGQFEQMLPLFAKYHVGSYHWGLVAGKTQTFYQYSAQKGDPMPEVWLHDALRPDGTPYDEAEMRMFSQFEFE